MPILTSLEIISYDVWENLKQEYSTKHLVLLPDEDYLKIIKNQMKKKNPIFSYLWESVKSYLAFPYEQNTNNDNAYIESQIIERIGSIYSAIGTPKNSVITEFMVNEINSFLKLFREDGLVETEVPLSIEEIKDRILQVSEDYELVYHGSNEAKEDEDGFVITYLTLKSVLPLESSFYLPIETSREKILSRNRFLLLSELGVFQYLVEHWRWSNVISDQLGESKLSFNETRFAKMVADIFEFPQTGTLRKDFNELKNKRDKIYPKKKQDTIKEQIASYGIEKVTK